jgi:hypothetical protein
MTVSLYAKQTMSEDILVGKQEIALEPQHGSFLFRITTLAWLSTIHIELDILFSSAAGHAGRPAEQPVVTPHLTIAVSASPSD